MKSKKIETIIFDFDGTIADTFGAVVKIINDNKERFGIDGIDKYEVTDLRNMSIKYLLREFKLNLFTLFKHITFVKATLAKQIDKVSVFAGISELLQNLVLDGYTLGIVTSNNKKPVNDFLKIHNLDSYFKFVIAEKHLFGKHRALINIMHKRGLENTRVLYVGDELRDIEAAKKANVEIISVDWGYNSHDLLARHNPAHLVSTPNGILELLKTL